MRRLAHLILVAAGLALIGPAAADDLAAPMPVQQACQVPDPLIFASSNLAAVAARRQAHQPIKIVVIGTASSLGGGVSRPENAYPMRLESMLKRRLPDGVSVLNKSNLHETAVDMVRRFARDVVAEHPALVIWQTGTTDAQRHVEAREFDSALSRGIEMLAEQHIDVVLMDALYSPHTAALINFRPYLQDMRLIAQSHDVILFQRNAIMQHWVEEGFFGTDEGSKVEQLHYNDMVHDCIADLLAYMIDSASGAAAISARTPGR